MYFPSLVLQFGNVFIVCIHLIAKHVIPRVFLELDIKFTDRVSIFLNLILGFD